MDIGVIAASLVVMRPCFHAMYYSVMRRSGQISTSYAPSGKMSGSRHVYGMESTKTDRTREQQNLQKILRTVDIELTSTSREELV